MCTHTFYVTRRHNGQRRILLDVTTSECVRYPTSRCVLIRFTLLDVTMGNVVFCSTSWRQSAYVTRRHDVQNYKITVFCRRLVSIYHPPSIVSCPPSGSCSLPAVVFPFSHPCLYSCRSSSYNAATAIVVVVVVVVVVVLSTPLSSDHHDCWSNTRFLYSPFQLKHIFSP